MKKYLIIVTVFLCNYAFSQTNVLYNFNENTRSSSLVKINEHYYTGTNTNIGGYGIKILKLNSFGEILLEKTIVSDTTQWRLNGETFYGNNNSQLMVYNDLSFNGNIYIGLSCLDINLDTIWTKNISLSDTLDILARKIIQTNDGGYILSGSTGNAEIHYQAFLLKTDSLGNQEWINYYGWENTNEQIYNIVEMTNGNFMLMGTTGNNPGSYIIHTDSLGNEIWNWANGINLVDLIQTSDSNFVAVGSTPYIDNVAGTFADARLIKFDINKNILFDTLFIEPFHDDTEGNVKFSSFGKIKELDDGDFLVMGYYPTVSDDMYLSTKLYILNSDFSLEDTKLFKPTPEPFVRGYIKDFIIEDDGSLAMIGDIDLIGRTDLYDSPLQRLWFVKTDSDYCDGFGSCDTMLRLEFLNLPETAYIKDTYDIHFRITGSNLTDLFNISFRFFVNNDDGHKGRTYFYNLIQDSIYTFQISKDIINSMQYSTDVLLGAGDSLLFAHFITASDSSSRAYVCSFDNAHRIDFIAGGSSISEIKKEATISVYPNPTDGDLNIEYININNSKSINIYDMQGRIVKSFSANNKFGFTMLDVSDLGKGNYIIGFDKNNSVKFIVQ